MAVEQTGHALSQNGTVPVRFRLDRYDRTRKCVKT
jgi:hypothetical protein